MKLFLATTMGSLALARVNVVERLKQHVAATAGHGTFRADLSNGQGQIKATLLRSAVPLKLSAENQQVSAYRPNGDMQKLGYVSFAATKQGLTFTHSDGHTLNCNARQGVRRGEELELTYACANAAQIPRLKRKLLSKADPQAFWHDTCDGHVPYCHDHDHDDHHHGDEWHGFDYPHFAVTPHGYLGCHELYGDYCEDVQAHNWINNWHYDDIHNDHHFDAFGDHHDDHKPFALDDHDHHDVYPNEHHKPTYGHFDSPQYHDHNHGDQLSMMGGDHGHDGHHDGHDDHPYDHYDPALDPYAHFPEHDHDHMHDHLDAQDAHDMGFAHDHLLTHDFHPQGDHGDHHGDHGHGGPHAHGCCDEPEEGCQPCDPNNDVPVLWVPDVPIENEHLKADCVDDCGNPLAEMKHHDHDHDHGDCCHLPNCHMDCYHPPVPEVFETEGHSH